MEGVGYETAMQPGMIVVRSDPKDVWNMIDFKPLTPADKPLYDRFLMTGRPWGCEYSFAMFLPFGALAAPTYLGHAFD